MTRTDPVPVSRERPGSVSEVYRAFTNRRGHETNCALQGFPSWTRLRENPEKASSVIEQSDTRAGTIVEWLIGVPGRHQLKNLFQRWLANFRERLKKSGQF